MYAKAVPTNKLYYRSILHYITLTLLTSRKVFHWPQSTVSSVPSGQSYFRSHFNCSSMQVPSWHRNCHEAQTLDGGGVSILNNQHKEHWHVTYHYNW